MSTDIVDGILATGKRRVGGYGHLIPNKRDWTEQDKRPQNIDGCSLRDVTGEKVKIFGARIFLRPSCLQEKKRDRMV